VRKVCIEKTGELVELLKGNEITKIKDILNFVKNCFNDSSRWVKNSAFQVFGEIIHKIYLKIDEKDVS